MFLCTSLLSAASLGPRPRSDSSLIPPTFCVEMMMDCSCGDGWIVACVDALGVIIMGGMHEQIARVKIHVLGVHKVLKWDCIYMVLLCQCMCGMDYGVVISVEES